MRITEGNFPILLDVVLDAQNVSRTALTRERVSASNMQAVARANNSMSTFIDALEGHESEKQILRKYVYSIEEIVTLVREAHDRRTELVNRLDQRNLDNCIEDFLAKQD